MRKIITRVLLIGAILLLNPGIMAGADEKQKQLIFDHAGLLTDQEIAKLEASARKYGAKRETDIIIVTTQDAEKDIVRFTQDFYDEKAPGYDKPHGNAVMLVIDKKSVVVNGKKGDVNLAGFYKAETYLDDSRLKLIRNKITPDLSAESYYEAFDTYIKTAYQYMGFRPGVDPNNPLFQWWVQVLAALVIAGATVGVMLYNSGGRVTVNESTYLDANRSRVLRRNDQYIRTTTTKRQKPKDNNNGSGFGGGGGGGGVTRGGHSHSGSRGSF